jgi:prophage regulatory protein
MVSTTTQIEWYLCCENTRETIVKLLSMPEVSEMTGIPEATLRYWRHKGGIGPASAKLGPRRVVYREADVEAWIEQQFSAAATRDDA